MAKLEDQKLIKELLEKEFSEKIIETSSAIIVGLDINHLIRIFNKGAEKITGYTKQEVIGKDWFEIFFPDIISEEMNEVWKDAWGISSHSYINPILNKTGGERIISWQTTGFYEREEKKNHLLISVGEDITDRKRAEEELKKHREHLQELVVERTADLQAVNKELESFVYSISHDLRAPLRSIMGFSEIIAKRHRDNLNEEGLEYFNYILEAGHNMENLIDDLLQYSRLGLKTKEKVNLTEIINEVMQNMEGDIKELKAKIVVPDKLPTIEGSRALFIQIFSNLIQNSLTYHQPKVPPEVTISVKRTKNKFILIVNDNGIGIAEEYHEKIFNIFQRLHSQEDYPGTGIGLAIAKKAVKALGGNIRLESEVGKGTTFFIELSGK